MQSFIESNEFASFVAVHGPAKATELLTAFVRGSETASDIHDKMCNALTTREGYTVDLIDNPFSAPAVDMIVKHAGAYDVYVHFTNSPGRVKAVDTTRFIDGATGRGVHGVYVGAEIVGRRDLEIETLPNGRLVAFVSRARLDVDAIRDVVVLLQRIGGKPPRARVSAASTSSGGGSAVDSEARVFKCKVCGKVFKNACGLANHMRHKHKEEVAAAAAAAATTAAPEPVTEAAVTTETDSV